jgi:hypothetical protein
MRSDVEGLGITRASLERSVGKGGDGATFDCPPTPMKNEPCTKEANLPYTPNRTQCHALDRAWQPSASALNTPIAAAFNPADNVQICVPVQRHTDSLQHILNLG